MLSKSMLILSLCFLQTMSFCADRSEDFSIPQEKSSLWNRLFNKRSLIWLGGATAGYIASGTCSQYPKATTTIISVPILACVFSCWKSKDYRAAKFQLEKTNIALIESTARALEFENSRTAVREEIIKNEKVTPEAAQSPQVRINRERLKDLINQRDAAIKEKDNTWSNNACDRYWSNLSEAGQKKMGCYTPDQQEKIVKRLLTLQNWQQPIPSEDGSAHDDEGDRKETAAQNAFRALIIQRKTQTAFDETAETNSNNELWNSVYDHTFNFSAGLIAGAGVRKGKSLLTTDY